MTSQQSRTSKQPLRLPAADRLAQAGALAGAAESVERALVSCLLQSEYVRDEITGLVDAEDFNSEALRLVFQQAADLLAEGLTTHPVILLDALRRSGRATLLQQLIGAVELPTWLDFLTGEVGTAIGAEYWAREVRRQAVLRRTASALAAASQSAIQAAAVENVDPRTILSDTMARLTALAPATRERPRFLAEVVQEDADGFERLVTDPRALAGFSSGLDSIDRVLNGWEPGRLVVVAARTSVGKSLFGLRVATGIAGGNGVPVQYVSLEMSRTQLVRRLLWSRSGISLGRLRAQDGITGEQFEAMEAARQWVSAIPVLIDDASGPDWSTVRASIEQGIVKDGARVVFVDHIDLLQHKRLAKQNRHQQLAGIMAELKGIAQNREVCMVVLSQINRAGAAREDAIPTLADLRESGSKEEDADQALLLYRPAQYRSDLAPNDPKHNELWVIVAKNRDGETGKRRLYVDLATQRIEEYVP